MFTQSCLLKSSHSLIKVPYCRNRLYEFKYLDRSRTDGVRTNGAMMIMSELTMALLAGPALELKVPMLTVSILTVPRLMVPQMATADKLPRRTVPKLQEFRGLYNLSTHTLYGA